MVTVVIVIHGSQVMMMLLLMGVRLIVIVMVIAMAVMTLVLMKQIENLFRPKLIPCGSCLAVAFILFPLKMRKMRHGECNSFSRSLFKF